MKKILLMIASSALMTACNNSGTSSESKKDSSTMTNANSMGSARERNEKTALASIEAFNAHDVAGTYKDATADAVEYHPAWIRHGPKRRAPFLAAGHG